MSLVTTKSEVAAIAALLVEGAESPDELAKTVIRRLTEMRGAREQYFTVVSLDAGVYVGEGPYSTRAAATKAAPKNLWITEFQRPWGVVSVNAQEHNLQRQQEAADKPPNQRGDWAEVELDRQAFKAGWNGKQATRARYLNAST